MPNMDSSAASRNPIRLSVIVPNYNHGPVIAEAIQAIASQSRPPDEILIVDDGSNDDSIAVIERLRSTFSTVRLIELKKNNGAIFALNRGIAEARGEFIYLAAADDVVLPGLFDTLLEMLEAYPSAALSCCECLVYDVDTGRNSVRPPLRPSYAPAYFNPEEVAATTRRADNWIISNSTIARRSLVVQAGGFDASLGSFADSYLFRHLAFQHGCCFVPRVGSVWRVTSRGYSRSQVANVDSALTTLSIALDRMRVSGAFPSWYPQIFERRWRFGIGRIALLADPMNEAVLRRIGRGPLGKLVLKASIKIGGVFGQAVALGWLTLQERPFSVSGIARTWLSRYVEKHAHRAQRNSASQPSGSSKRSTDDWRSQPRELTDDHQFPELP